MLLSDIFSVKNDEIFFLNFSLTYDAQLFFLEVNTPTDSYVSLIGLRCLRSQDENRRPGELYPGLNGTAFILFTTSLPYFFINRSLKLWTVETPKAGVICCFSSDFSEILFIEESEDSSIYFIFES